MSISFIWNNLHEETPLARGNTTYDNSNNSAILINVTI